MSIADTNTPHPSTEAPPVPADGAAAGPAAITVHGLAKSFGEVQAVRGVDFEVATGEVFGFLGPNGAGKTTTINMLCTLAKPTPARRAWPGTTSSPSATTSVATSASSSRTRRSTATSPPRRTSGCTPSSTACSPIWSQPRMQQVMEMVGLWDRKDSVVGTFSGGMRRRLEIARGLMHSPRVLFLDEPTIGLDPQTRRSIWDYIRELKEREEITIFMTTHYMDEAEWCDRIAIMDHGEIVALDSPEALKAAIGEDRVTIHTDDDAAAIAALAAPVRDRGQVSEGAVTFRVPAGEQFVPRLFAEFELPIRSVSVSRPTLDDVFMSFTGTLDPRCRGGRLQAPNRVMMQMMGGGGRR